MDIKPIRTNADYRAALKTAESLMTSKANSLEGDRLDVLVSLIEAYEHELFPTDSRDVQGKPAPDSID